MDIQLKKGLLEACVLKVLSKNDSYGYKIISDVSKYIEVSESTLYPVLRRLELAEYLSIYKEEHNGRLRKYYKITSLGLEKLEEFRKEITKLEKIEKFILGGKHD